VSDIPPARVGDIEEMSSATRTPPELITSYGDNSPFAEAYRMLRLNLLQANGRALWSVGITGVEPGHGSTTTAANLGLVVGETGNRVVLVDADLYRPSLHRLFGVANDVGLSSILQGKAEVSRALQTVTDPPVLRILPAGPKVPNPTALMRPAALDRFFGRLREEADFVIVDMPSIRAVAYTSLLASLLDGVLLVVRAGTSPRGVDYVMKRRLHGVNVVGMVLNQVPVDGSEITSYRYYAHSRS